LLYAASLDNEGNIMNHDARTLRDLDRDHVIHPYTDFSTFAQEGSQVIVRGDGMHVTDAEGRRYLDGIAGLWCVNIGHGREEMAEALARQVRELAYYNPFGHTTSDAAAELGSRLSSLSPGDLNHMFFTTGGSTANDVAVRLAHFYFHQRGMPQKRHVISRVDAYHGSTYFAANLTGIQATKIGFNQIAEDLISYVSSPSLYRRPAGAEGLDEVEYVHFLAHELDNHIRQIGPDKVAAFIAEPIQGAGGVLVAPEGYHRAMKEVCEAHDVLYIMDEVVTAFGRLGEWFSSESVFGIVPDIICGAKGITSGYVPLGVAMISDRVYAEISRPQAEAGVLSMGFTYTGHPLACAAALTNIDIMEREDLPGQVRQRGPLFQSTLGALADHPLVGDVRGSHLMLGIELVADKARKTPFEATVGSANRVFRRCLDLGLVVRPIGNILVLSPPLIISEDQIQEIHDTLEKALNETADELTRAGLLAA
jgi:adenosylmethionine-8-amino-7-oxononanoate aminotransferase